MGVHGDELRDNYRPAYGALSCLSLYVKSLSELCLWFVSPAPNYTKNSVIAFTGLSCIW